MDIKLHGYFTIQGSGAWGDYSSLRLHSSLMLLTSGLSQNGSSDAWRETCLVSLAAAATSITFIATTVC